MIDEPKHVPHKPAKDHPWRKQMVNKQIKEWARIESDLMPVHTIVAARPETLRVNNHRTRKRKGL